MSLRNLVSPFPVILALGLMAGWPLAQDVAEERVLDEIVAKVNQDIITLTDLQSELRLLRLSLQEEVSDPNQLEQVFQAQKRSLLRNLIQNKVMLQKAEELGIMTNVDPEVNAAIEQMRQQMGIPSLEVLEQLLQQRGTNLQEYRTNLKERMVMDWLIQQSVYSKITLLTSEIEEYYQAHQDEFTEPARVTLAEIVFLKEGKPADEIRARAEEAHQKLQAGTPFDEVASQYSDGPTAAKGGIIGEFPEGSLDPQVETNVFGLSEGEFSGILEADYGLAIFKVVTRQGRTVKPMDEVSAQIRRQLYQRKAQPELTAFLDDLIEQSFIYVAPKYKVEYNVEDVVR